MARGSVSKRCGCRDEATGVPLGAKCPRLRRKDGAWNPGHGTWSYRQELPPRADRTRRTPIRRAGLSAKDKAETELERLQAILELADSDDQPTIETIITIVKDAIAADNPLPQVEQVRKRLRAGPAFTTIPTVADWLVTWLAGKKKLRTATAKSYGGHIRNYLVPYLGEIRIDRLTLSQVADMFDWIEERNEQIREARQAAKTDRRRLSRAEQAKLREVLEAFRWQKPISAAGKQAVRATLRNALNDFITQSQGLITFNPAAHLELPSGKAPKPQVWTDEYVTSWQETGLIPAPVMVWTPQQTARFLDHAADDRQYALYYLLAKLGPRRGETLGLHLTDLDRRAKTLTIRWQLSAAAWTPELTPPKTDASQRTLPLNDHDLAVIDAHLARRDAERAAAGPDWSESGLIFTTQTGQPLHPQKVSDHFRDLTDQTGLPPVRLHGLRHGTATVLLAAGADIKIVQEVLGHTQLATTADLYTSVLSDVLRGALTQSGALIDQHRNPGHPTVTPPTTPETRDNPPGDQETNLPGTQLPDARAHLGHTKNQGAPSTGESAQVKA